MTTISFEFIEDAVILNSNIQAILKTHEKINEFYLRLDEDVSDTDIHRFLYQIRKLHQCNSIAKVFTNQDFMTNPIETLTMMFNESITKYHVEQMHDYGVVFNDVYSMWVRDHTIRFGRVLGILANA